jgi:hypothetical protein
MVNFFKIFGRQMNIPDVRILDNQEFTVYGKLMNISTKF